MKSLIALKWFTVATLLIACTFGCSENSEGNNPEKTDIEKLNEIYGVTEESTKGEPKESVIIGNLEIAGEDFPDKMGWGEAKQECQKMGDGWRLPTIDELFTIYDNREKIGGFETGGAFAAYWSSTRYEYDEQQVWTLSFHDGLRYKQVLGVVNASFRPVRDKK